MAIAWVLRDSRATSALIGPRNLEQLDNSLDAMQWPQFSEEELREIHKHANEGSIDL
jgi:L-glyceraldehyde 3-phosphate reductase